MHGMFGPCHGWGMPWGGGCMGCLGHAMGWGMHGMFGPWGGVGGLRGVAWRGVWCVGWGGAWGGLRGVVCGVWCVVCGVGWEMGWVVGWVGWGGVLYANGVVFKAG